MGTPSLQNPWPRRGVSRIFFGRILKIMTFFGDVFKSLLVLVFQKK